MLDPNRFTTVKEGMKNTIWNRIKLSLHCAFFFHIDGVDDYGGDDVRIGCYECKFGKLSASWKEGYRIEIAKRCGIVTHVNREIYK